MRNVILITVILTATYLAHSKQEVYRTPFPLNLPHHQWVSFEANGYDANVTGVIYRGEPYPVSGMPLGGIDTGCLDIEATGLLGYSSIFNDLFPRQLLNVPFLGVCVGDDTWVLTTKKAKKYAPIITQDSTVFPACDFSPKYFDINLPDIKSADSIDYWGHYPIVDMTYQSSAPVDVSLRAWSPFVPGDTVVSMLPGAVFEINVQNKTMQRQAGSVIVNFPGFTSSQTDINYGKAMPNFKDLMNKKPIQTPDDSPWIACYVIDPHENVNSEINREVLSGELNGLHVARTAKGNSWEMSFVLASTEPNVRYGGSLNLDATKWSKAAQSLPQAQPNDTGASLAIDFDLEPNSNKNMVIILSWYAPYWRSGGAPYLGGQLFKHMYSKYHDDPVANALYLVKNRSSILKRIIAWQQEVYQSPKLPGWLADSLINYLHLITECSVWGQSKGTIAWSKPEDGIFGMNECPRGCPQIECIPCTFYGGMPLVYFFPECALSTIRAYKHYQFEDGRMPWVFGGSTVGTPPYDLSLPAKGYQTVLNGLCYVVAVDRYRQVSKDDKILGEFWESLKKCTDFSFNLRPSYGLSQIVAMPATGTDNFVYGETEWFEAPEPGWRGYVTHAGGLRMAQAQIMRRMADKMGDKEYAAKCDAWLAAGAKAMEEHLWAGSYYLNFDEPETGKKSDLVFGYQLDGQWLAACHGVPRVFPKNRTDTVLATLSKINDPLSKSGVVNYANPDGTAAKISGYGPYSYMPQELMMLAMTYMYEGQREHGIDLLQKCIENIVCKWAYTWDAPNIMRGDNDTGQRHYGADYYQNLMIWLVPAAINNQSLSGPCSPDGLVQRVISAGSTVSDIIVPGDKGERP